MALHNIIQSCMHICMYVFSFVRFARIAQHIILGFVLNLDVSELHAKLKRNVPFAHICVRKFRQSHLYFNFSRIFGMHEYITSFLLSLNKVRVP